MRCRWWYYHRCLPLNHQLTQRGGRLVRAYEEAVRVLDRTWLVPHRAVDWGGGRRGGAAGSWPAALLALHALPCTGVALPAPSSLGLNVQAARASMLCLLC